MESGQITPPARLILIDTVCSKKVLRLNILMYWYHDEMG